MNGKGINLSPPYALQSPWLKITPEMNPPSKKTEKSCQRKRVTGIPTTGTKLKTSLMTMKDNYVQKTSSLGQEYYETSI